MKVAYLKYIIENHTGGCYGWSVTVEGKTCVGTLNDCKAWINQRGWLRG